MSDSLRHETIHETRADGLKMKMVRTGWALSSVVDHMLCMQIGPVQLFSSTVRARKNPTL